MRIFAPDVNQFQSTHLSRGATGGKVTTVRNLPFQSTHLSRGATLVKDPSGAFRKISIHAPLTRCDSILSFDPEWDNISIHAPLTRCDCRHGPIEPRQIISIHAPLTRCDDIFALGIELDDISIHAPLTRCDCIRCSITRDVHYFNPRTSHEVRREVFTVTAEDFQFQSTHLSRGATGISTRSHRSLRNFNPRTSHEVRPRRVAERG